jgi:hypothetical protein
MLELWPDYSFEEEFKNNQELLRTGKETSFLAESDEGEYMGNRKDLE